MTPERWGRVRAVFDAAAELPTDERPAFVARACGDDLALRADVDRLLGVAGSTVDGLRDAVAGEAARVATGLAPGWRLGPYRLIRELGAGGMGAVYLAERDDDEYRTQVAIKVLPLGLRSEHAVARFRDERQILAGLHHPGIVRLLDGGTEGGLPYLVMERIDGVPITRFAEEQRLPLRAKLELFLAVCDALQYAHQKVVVHRDIKPSNILVQPDGVPKLVDFGIARLLAADADREASTGTGMAPYTLGYASPEQVRGQPVSTVTDVYSLGAVLYELLTGVPAHRLPAGDAVGALHVICDVDPVRPSVAAPALRAELTGDLDTIVQKAMHKEPARRYPSVEQFALDVRCYLDERPIAARPSTWGYRTGKLLRRQRGLVTAAALLVTALAVVGTVVVRARVRARRDAAASEQRARLATRLGQDVDQLEWLVRTADLLPLHDVSVEESVVRARMDAIAARAGDDAVVDYALGRGHLALGEDDLARARFDRARAAGLDTPELHYARGVVLGRLYQRELASARQRGEGRWLERRTRELDDELLAPALAALEQSRGVRLDSPAYLDGLIAYDRKDYPAAIALAARARAEAPWLYDGLRLSAAAHLARGIAVRQRDRAAGIAELEAAGRDYDDALAIGRSDQALYLGRAQVWIERMQMVRQGAPPPPEPVGQAEGWCRSAAIVAPRAAAPWRALADVRYVAGAVLFDRGDDPRPVLDGAVEAARAVLARDPDDLEGHVSLGFARGMASAYDLLHGIDYAPLIEEMLAHERRAVELAPRHPPARRALALAYLRVATRQSMIGEDPTAALQAAIDQLQASLVVDPDSAGAYRNWIYAERLLAEHLVRHRRDPRPLAPAVEQALAACRQVTEESVCHEAASWFFEMLARHQLDVGGDPAADLDRAASLLAVCRERGLDTLPVRASTAGLALLRARAAVRAGRDVDGARAELARSVAACYQLDTRHASCSSMAAEGALLFAHGRADLLRARTLAVAAVDADPRDPDPVVLLVDASLRLGDRPAARAACARGLALDPTHASLRARCAR